MALSGSWDEPSGLVWESDFIFNESDIHGVGNCAAAAPWNIM